MGGTRNTLFDLNNHLFAQLERLNDEDLKGENLKVELGRTKAITEVAKNVIDNGKLVLEAKRFQHDDRLDSSREVPRMLEGDTNR